MYRYLSATYVSAGNSILEICYEYSIHRLAHAIYSQSHNRVAGRRVASGSLLSAYCIDLLLLDNIWGRPVTAMVSISIYRYCGYSTIC
jgi:hypothetical protein